MVTAPRLAETARSEQRLSPLIQNVQSIETILQYPDFNAAEALGRIPGVSLSSDTGEGRFVNIRGLDANLNGATFGGIVLLNTYPGGTINGTGRAVEFDTIPVGIVDRLVVYKTRLPSQEAEGLGGSVEVSPRSAAAIKDNFVEGIVGGGYQPLRESWDTLRLEGTVGGRIALGGFENPKPLAFVLTGSFNSDKRGVDDVEPGYVDNTAIGTAPVYTPTGNALGGIDLRRYTYFRRRFAYGGDISFTPNARASFYVRASVAGYVERVRRQVFQINDLDSGDLTQDIARDPANPNIFIVPSATTRITSRNEQEQHRNTILATGGKFTFGDDIRFDYTLAYSRAVFFKSFDFGARFAGPEGVIAAYDNLSNPNRLPVSLAGVDPADGTRFTLNRITDDRERDRDREYTVAANLTVPVPLGENGEVTAGGRARLRNKYSSPAGSQYDLGGYTGPRTLDQLSAGKPVRFYDGLYDIGVQVAPAKIRGIAAGLPNVLNTSDNASGSFDDDEDVYAGFAQYQGSFGKLGVLAGVRVEYTDGRYRSFDVLTPPALADGTQPDDVITPVARRARYTDAFPTVQLRYAFTPQLIARATYSTAIGRPGFNQLLSGRRVDANVPSVDQGNPALKPTTGNSFDLSVEYYLPNNGIISLGAFDKEFRNYVVRRSIFGTIIDRAGENLGQGFSNTYFNARTAYARGVEAAYSQRFAMLPAPFDGLGLEGNITLVDSQVELRPGDFRLLPATSKVTWNASAFYDARHATVRVSAQYVSSNLFGVGGGPQTDVIQDKRLTVDATGAYEMRKGVQVYFNAKNLTNTPLRYYEGVSTRPIQREFYLQTYEAGVRFHF